jgi:hypothetical protein
MQNDKMGTQKTILLCQQMLSKIASLKNTLGDALMAKDVESEFFIAATQSTHELERNTKLYLLRQEEKYKLLGGMFEVPKVAPQSFLSRK